MADEVTPERRVLLGQVHARVGRNVIRVQSLESGLKTLVPFLDLRGAPHCLDGLITRHAQVARNTLGQLAGLFLGSTSIDDPRLSEMIESILKDRNNLVHHFHATLGCQMSTLEGCARVNAQLDEQFEAIKLLERLVNELLMDVLHALRDITFKGAADYDDFAALCCEFSTALRATGLLDLPPDHRDG